MHHKDFKLKYMEYQCWLYKLLFFGQSINYYTCYGYQLLIKLFHQNHEYNLLAGALHDTKENGTIM